MTTSPTPLRTPERHRPVRAVSQAGGERVMEPTAEKDAPKIDHLIELRGVYDGWSIAVMTDGAIKNRWANDAGDGPEPGYERRWSAAEDAIALMLDPAEKRVTPPGEWDDDCGHHPEWFRKTECRHPDCVTPPATGRAAPDG